ncbi:hypothetical protein HBI82_046280 [Parastagonospora nodorum]|nr:hypothetical protein HBH75_155450 [Parastagonospora nodorum]KAH6031364.1 hypothetical protein HBI82_046280 [Parastagonospora nodorum]KAH6204186.1 hypothetical protein HBI43_201440 [Parastagonospora nodorum]KAH6244643.1 hypothetical protein HBI42_202440 [Parastagonospora nodorum]
MSSSSQNTATPGGKRSAIKKMIDDSIVTVNLPECSKTEFFPSSRVAEIATIKNISEYTAEDPSTHWGKEDRADVVRRVHETASKLFICCAKNMWPMAFLNHVVDIAKFLDKDIYGEELLETNNQENKEGGFQDKLIEEMEIHKMSAIEPGNFDQSLVREQYPFTSVTRVFGLAPAVPQRYNVHIHEDYWNGPRDDFVMMEYKSKVFPDHKQFGDAIAGFYSRHEDQRETYCLLFPKHS